MKFPLKLQKFHFQPKQVLVKIYKKCISVEFSDDFILIHDLVELCNYSLTKFCKKF